MGLFIESVGTNPTASRFSGIKSKNIIFWCYVFTGFCAGIAGAIYCSNVKSADGNNAGLLMELDAIAAVVIGGTLLTGGVGYVFRTVFGVLIYGSLGNTNLVRT
jgi:simple sugar transport system permease protein